VEGQRPHPNKRNRSLLLHHLGLNPSLSLILPLFPQSNRLPLQPQHRGEMRRSPLRRLCLSIISFPKQNPRQNRKTNNLPPLRPPPLQPPQPSLKPRHEQQRKTIIQPLPDRPPPPLHPLYSSPHPSFRPRRHPLSPLLALLLFLCLPLQLLALKRKRRRELRTRGETASKQRRRQSPEGAEKVL